MKSPYQNIDTPALLIDREIMLDNLRWMQEKADRWGVNLRPHTKTHKMPALAKLQLQTGAVGITGTGVWVICVTVSEWRMTGAGRGRLNRLSAEEKLTGQHSRKAAALQSA